MYMAADKPVDHNNLHDDSSDEDDVDYVPPPEPLSRKPNKSRRAESTLNAPELSENEEENVGPTDDSKIVAKRPHFEHGHMTDESDLQRINDLWVQLTAGLEVSKMSSSVEGDDYFSEWLHNRHTNDDQSVTANLPCLAVLEARQRRDERQRQKQRLKHPLNKNKPARQLGLLNVVSNTSLEKKPEQAITKAKNARRMTGLEVALSLIRGQDPDTLLDRTKRAWDDFKTDAPNIRDELEEHKKDKGRYTSKVAFLERSDVREWEYEQKGRKFSRH